MAMAQLHRHVRALTATVRAAAQFEASRSTTISASAQDSLRSLACPLGFQSRSVHLRPQAALQTAYTVHQDAAKERQNTSSSANGQRAGACPHMTSVHGQPSRLYSSVAVDALSQQAGLGSKKQGTPPKHRGGPQAAIAAKESWPMQYQHMGRIEGQLSIPRKPVFAVIELGATQYKVPSRSLSSPLTATLKCGRRVHSWPDCSVSSGI